MSTPMKDAILDVIRSRTKDGRSCLMSELVYDVRERGLPCAGTHSIVPASRPHVMIWAGLSEQFTVAYTELKNDRLIEEELAHPLEAWTGPMMLSLPFATPRRVSRGKRPCWLPVKVRIAKQP